MTAYYMDNYTAQYITKPSLKIEKGEVAGRRRLLFDVRTIAETLQVGDIITCCAKIPANSMVIDAKVRVDKSLGATGIFSLGYAANGVDVADANAFITSIDAGGQAVLQRPSSASTGIFQRFTAETQVTLTCTEVLDGNVVDGKIYVDIDYVND